MNGLDSKIRMGASPRELPEVLRTANHKLWQDAAIEKNAPFFNLRNLYSGFVRIVMRRTNYCRADISRGNTIMEDLIWVAITIAFFALSIGYVHFCDRVK
jgi:hypothetical protein